MSVKPDKLILGIDIGGTKILTAVANTQGEMLSRDHSITPAKEGQEAIIQSILQSVERTFAQAYVSASDLSSVGIAAPGISDPQTGILFTSPNLPGVKEVHLADIIGKHLGIKSFLINDANAAAVGELHFGSGQGFRNFIYITVSTGIGGGIIIDGKIYTGCMGMAGELGHMVIDDNGPICNCGNKGCWETLASGTALAREARSRINEGAETSILKYAPGDSQQINAETIYMAAQAGDKLANELISQTGYYLGVGLANLINIFNPELIVIGGGLTNIGNMLLGPAYKEAQQRAFEQAYKTVHFAPAKLGRNSGVLGAVAFALEKMNERETWG